MMFFQDLTCNAHTTGNGWASNPLLYPLSRHLYAWSICGTLGGQLQKCKEGGTPTGHGLFIRFRILNDVCEYVSVCSDYDYRCLKGQKSNFDPLQLELQVTVNHPSRCWEQKPGFLGE